MLHARCAGQVPGAQVERVRDRVEGVGRMSGLGRRRLVVDELAPLDDLEAALRAVVQGRVRGVTVAGVADLLGGPGVAGLARTDLPEALGTRRLCSLDEQERVDRMATLALWTLAQPMATVAELRATPAGEEVVWAQALLRVARDDGRPVLVGAASVGWSLAEDRIAAWLGPATLSPPEVLLVAADPPGTATGLLYCCRGLGVEEPADPLGQTLAELFADVKHRLLESVTILGLRGLLAREQQPGRP